MVHNINLKELQCGSETEMRRVYELFGCELREKPTFEYIQRYPLEQLLPSQEVDEDRMMFRNRAYNCAERIVNRVLEVYGWRYRIFGPDIENHRFTPADFKVDNYETRCIWIYQPYSPEAAGNESPGYTFLWTVSHELAHALTNDETTHLFGGQGRRQGALGIETIHPSGNGVVPPLSLADALRVLAWEDATARRQRLIVEQDYSLPVSGEDFFREYQFNVAGSVIRILCGDFATPGKIGVLPRVDCGLSFDEIGRAS